jgi:hypothetical protein
MPNDIENGIETWPEGLGEITRLGIQQEYRLGQLIRRRYNNYLSTEYNGKDFYVKSSDRNRTLMSAQTVMMAIYPRLGVNFSDQVNPIPVHTVSFERDKVIFYNVSQKVQFLDLKSSNKLPDCYMGTRWCL